MTKKDLRLPEDKIEVREVHDYFEIDLGENLDVLFHDEFGYGNCYAFSNENEGEGKYKVELFSARISDPEADFEKINEELGAGRNNQWNDTSDPEEACQFMLEYYRIFDQDNPMDEPLYIVPDYATGFRMLDKLNQKYLFVIIQNQTPDEIADETTGAVLVHRSSIEVYELEYKNETYDIHVISDPEEGNYQDTKVYSNGIEAEEELASEVIDIMESLL